MLQLDALSRSACPSVLEAVTAWPMLSRTYVDASHLAKGQAVMGKVSIGCVKVSKMPLKFQLHVLTKLRRD